MAPRIDTVVFDLGGVLVGWDPARALAGSYAPAQIEEFFAAVDFAAFNHRQDAGRSWADARAELAGTAPDYLSHLDLYVDRFADSLTGPVPGSAEVLSELKAAEVRVLGLTNWSAETFRHASAAAPVLAELEAILVSGEVGLAKPDPAIFELLIERFSLDPRRTVFVDDSETNVRAAAALGLDAIRFSDAGALRQDLMALGLPISPLNRPRACSRQNG